MDFEEALRNVEAAKGDPRRLTLAALDLVFTAHDPDLRPMLEAAAVPHWFDARILASLLGLDQPEAERKLAGLARLPVVEPFRLRDGFNVHEATRLALRMRMAKREPARFVELSERAAACFDGEAPHLRIERLYHLLASRPEEGAKLLKTTFDDWQDRGLEQHHQALNVALSDLLATDILGETPRARVLLCSAWIEWGRSPLKSVEAKTRQALALFEKRSDPHSQADARALLAGVLQDQGRLGDALSEYQTAKKILLGLTRQAPDNIVLRRDLAHTRMGVGRVLEEKGDLKPALEEIEAAQDTMRDVSESAPEKSGWRRDLSITHSFKGGVLETLDRLDEALTEYQASLAIRLELSRKEPDNPLWKRDVCVAHNRVGGVLFARKRHEEALREFQDYKRIALELTQRDPDNPDWLHELSVAHNCVGRVLQEQGKLPEALREFETFKRIAAELAQLDPDNAEWRREMSVAHNCVGDVWRLRSRWEEALREFETAREMRLQLVALSPDNAGWKAELASSHRRAAESLHELGRVPEAIREWESAAGLLDELVSRDDPKAEGWRKDLQEVRRRIEEARGRSPGSVGGALGTS